MNLSEQFWLSILIQVIAGVAIVAMMKQQLRDLVGWVREVNAEVKRLRGRSENHEGRLAHVEGRLGIPLKADDGG